MRKIMYIGKKPTKIDNVCENRTDRIWTGLGAVEEVSDLDAGKLTKHRGIWMDVTDMDEDTQSKLIAGLRDKYRAEERAMRGPTSASLLSDDELEAELRRRRKTYGLRDENEAGPEQVSLQNAPRGSIRNESEEKSRPDSTEALLADIVGVILALDRESTENFDLDGAPQLPAICEALGYRISQSELNAAVEQINAA